MLNTADKRWRIASMRRLNESKFEGGQLPQSSIF